MKQNDFDNDTEAVIARRELRAKLLAPRPVGWKASVDDGMTARLLALAAPLMAGVPGAIEQFRIEADEARSGVAVNTRLLAIGAAEHLRPPHALDEALRDIIGVWLNGNGYFRQSPDYIEGEFETGRGEGFAGASTAAGAAVLTQTAPATRQSMPAPEWHKLARKQAKQIIDRQRAKDLYPSQTDIADEIARTFRTDGIVGEGGKPLAGAYIKRHALKGVSSEQGRQLSTGIRQGN